MDIIILILLLISICFEVVLLYMHLMKYEKVETKTNKPELTREEKEKQEQLKKSFDNLMRYDENAARKSRK